MGKMKNTIVDDTDRKPMYENDFAKSVGMMATCNNCDRIIYEDEEWKDKYIETGGYCRECSEE